MIKHLCYYLDSNNILYTEDFENETSCITVIYDECSNLQKGALKCNIWFYKYEIEIYYKANVSKWCETDNISSFLQSINYINRYVLPDIADSIDRISCFPHKLVSPRLYITDAGEVVLRYFISYDYYVEAPFELAEYICVRFPKLLDKLSPVIFGTLLGKLNVEHAICYVKEHILEDIKKEVGPMSRFSTS